MNLYKYLCSFENHVDLDHLDTSHLHLPVFDFRRRALKEYIHVVSTRLEPLQMQDYLELRSARHLVFFQLVSFCKGATETK